MKENVVEFIFQSLMVRTKKHISYLGELMNCELQSGLSKSEMASILADYIINRSDEWLRCLPQRELDLLEIMVKMEKGDEFRTFLQPYHTILESLGFLFEERTDDSSIFTIAPEIYDSIREHLPLALSFRAATGYMEFEAVLTGMLNIYGLLELDDVMKLFATVYDFETAPESAAMSLQFLSETFLLKVPLLCLDDVIYKSTIFMRKNIGKMVTEKRKEIKDYCHFIKEEYMSAGLNPLYPFVGWDSKYGRKLISYMKEIGLSKHTSDVLGSLIWLKAQECGDDVMTEVLSLFDGLIDDDARQRELKIIIRDYIENVPKWCYKGFSSNEISKKSEKPSAENTVKAIFGSFVPKVGLNDLCPCGSGLKYKNCHGKYNN